MDQLLKIIDEIEDQLQHHHIEKETGMRFLEGNIPILCSAPHSVDQLRNGYSKAKEERTAPLVHYLNQVTGSYGAYKTMNFLDDANYDEKNYYKEMLIPYIKTHSIKCLLDFHIMNENREYSLEIGTGDGKNILNQTHLLPILTRQFQIHDIRPLTIDHLFKANNPNTVSATIARECHIPCFQLEMNWSILKQTKTLFPMAEALKAIILELKEILV